MEAEPDSEFQFRVPGSAEFASHRPVPEVRACFPCQKQVVTYGQRPRRAPVAQLDRATVYGTVGYTFEPCRVHDWS
jgi:hypothetical protein